MSYEVANYAQGHCNHGHCYLKNTCQTFCPMIDFMIFSSNVNINNNNNNINNNNDDDDDDKSIAYFYSRTLL